MEAHSKVPGDINFWDDSISIITLTKLLNLSNLEYSFLLLLKYINYKLI
jgi:hypothetical protein